MKNIFEYICFVSLSRLIRFLGINLSRRLSPVLAGLFFYLIPIRKSTTIENLKNAFPDLDNNKIKKTAFNCFNSFCITLIEILYMPAMNKSEIKKQVKCINPDLIKSKFDEQKGVILLSAHYGNWEYVATSVAAQL
ncbi:MAG: hypothetical protein P8Y79_09940, partial [Ignavibacteriaceae bacterium]